MDAKDAIELEHRRVREELQDHVYFRGRDAAIGPFEDEERYQAAVAGYASWATEVEQTAARESEAFLEAHAHRTSGKYPWVLPDGTFSLQCRGKTTAHSHPP